MATAPISVGYGIYKSPKYYINPKSGGQDLSQATASQAQDIIDNSPDAEFAKTEIDIVNKDRG